MNNNSITGTGRILEGMGVLAAVFSGAFLVAFVAISQFIPVEESSAAEIDVVNEARGYYADITSSGSVGIDVVANAEGQTEMLADSLTIDTNAKNGYKLFIATSGSSNALYPNGDATESSSIAAASTSTAGALTTNTWGYVPDRDTSSGTAVVPTADSTTFKGVPTKGNDALLYTNTSPSTSGTNAVNVYYGTKVDTTRPSGDYTLTTDTSGATPVTDTIVYTAIVEAVNGDLQNASINPTYQDGLDGGQTVTIATGLYPGYTAQEFIDNNWIRVTIDGEDCTSVTPSITGIGTLNIQCTTPQVSSAGEKTVAVYIDPYNYSVDAQAAPMYTLSYEYKQATMQSFQCSSLANIGDTAELKDIRVVNGEIAGEETYSVAKLADGKCWMTEDLKAGAGTYNHTTTNLGTVSASDYTIPAQNTGTWCATNDAACYQNSNWIISTNSAGSYLYNYYTATGGPTSNIGYDATQPTGDICPAGWQLPSGGSGGDFANLDIAMGGTGANRTDTTARDRFMTGYTTAPVNMNYTGFRYGSSTGYATTDAYYWSRTVLNSLNAYYLGFNSSGDLGFQTHNFKNFGLAIRCVAK